MNGDEGTPALERYELSCRVDPYRAGWTLSEFLAHRFRYFPMDVWRERIASGSVRVNDRTAGAETRVEREDVVRYAFDHAEPSVDFRYEVLHEDEHVLAVSKSGNLPVHAGGPYIRNTLIARLRRTWGDELRLAHRLDRETSGVVLLAKSRDAARALEREFHGRRVCKSYVAVVRGRPPARFVVDAPIARRKSAPPFLRIVDRAAGKPSRTSFRVLRREGSFTWVAARPTSGRTNQIRVHAAHAGYPIVGDRLYGAPEDAESGPVPRHLLHCRALSLAHPAGTGILRLRAAVPPDFGVLSNVYVGPAAGGSLAAGAKYPPDPGKDESN